jgi:hypothetical protein
MQIKINYHCVIILLLLKNNKLALNDQIKCCVINACIFYVLDNDPNSLSVFLVYFRSRQHPIRSFLLYQSNNIILHEYIIYCIDTTTDTVQRYNIL